MHYPLLFSFIFTRGLGGLVQHLDGRFENGESSRKEVTCGRGIFIQVKAGRLSISYIWALVGFSDASFADVEVGEGLGRHRRHCGGFSLFFA